MVPGGGVGGCDFHALGYNQSQPDGERRTATRSVLSQLVQTLGLQRTRHSRISSRVAFMMSQRSIRNVAMRHGGQMPAPSGIVARTSDAWSVIGRRWGAICSAACRRTSENAEFWTSRRSCPARRAGLGRHDANFVCAPGGASHARLRHRRARRGGYPKMRGQDMNAMVEVHFLARTPPPDLGCRLREATFPARSRPRILRFQMLVDSRASSSLARDLGPLPRYRRNFPCGGARERWASGSGRSRLIGG